MKVSIKDRLAGIPATKLAIGAVGRLIGQGSCDGHLVLRTYEGWVSLQAPLNTWGVGSTFNVEPLPPGTEITLIVE